MLGVSVADAAEFLELERCGAFAPRLRFPVVTPTTGRTREHDALPALIAPRAPGARPSVASNGAFGRGGILRRSLDALDRRIQSCGVEGEFGGVPGVY